MVAALFVARGGVYFGMPDVDPWDEARDARLYAGPHPVVAHPPCARWCRLAGLVEKRWGHKRGEDGGCFAAALNAVRTWGGVLEHPAYSDAWAHFGLPRPKSGAGWQADHLGGWSCYVEQWFYGHPAKKPTWLYAVGVELPTLRWGHVAKDEKTAYVTDGGGDIKRRRRRALVSYCGNHTDPADDRKRLTSKAAAATPPDFAAELLGMARTVEMQSRRARAATPPQFRDVLLSIATTARRADR